MNGEDIMIENKALLSQSEIDTLISFILDNAGKATEGEVLDQISIDKLVAILKAGPANRFRFDSAVPAVNGTAFIEIEGMTDSAELRKDCLLEAGIDSEGNVVIKCINKKEEKECIITPLCYENMKYINDDSRWGFAVPPVTFGRLAVLFDLKYSRNSYDCICERFAEIMYGDKKHKIAEIYMPAAEVVVKYIMV